jgi:integrase
MSVQSYKTKDGPRYRVRWYEGTKPKSRSFLSKRKANAFDTEVKARKQRGEALPQTGRQTLAAVHDEWWRLRRNRLSKHTQESYERHWNAHLKGRWDHYKLSDWVTNPQLFDDLIADLEARGVGPASQRKVFVILSAVFSTAVEWKKVGINPVLTAPKPSASPKHLPRPFAALVIERIRLQMQRRKTKDTAGVRGDADAVMVELMAYAGLRPGEALALTWLDVEPKKLRIEKSVALGEVQKKTKTGGVREPPLVAPLASDLQNLYERRGEPRKDELILPAPDGAPWSHWQYNNWRSRVWRPVMKNLAECDPPQPELATARPYDCRGTFVSLHLDAYESPVQIAAWAGHSTKVMYEHYAGVIENRSREPIPVEQQIEQARSDVLELERAELDKMMAELLD